MQNRIPPKPSVIAYANEDQRHTTTGADDILSQPYISRFVPPEPPGLTPPPDFLGEQI